MHLVRRRRSAVGLALTVVVMAAGWRVAFASAADSGPIGERAPARRAHIVASVEANGVPVGAPVGWRVTHRAQGSYELTFRRPIRVTVQSWEVPATVLIRPLTDRTWRIDFVDDHRGVDAAFTFMADPLP